MRKAASALRLLLALSCTLALPPQTWAQVASLGGRAAGSSVAVPQIALPALPSSVSPLSGAPTLSIGQGLSSPGTLPAAAPSAAAKARASAPSGLPLPVAQPLRPHARAAAVPAAQTPAEGPSPAGVSSKLSELTGSAAPLLKTVAKDGASAASLRGTGADLQDLLQGAASRRYASDEPVPVRAASTDKESPLSRHAEHAASSPAGTPAPEQPGAGTRSGFGFYAGAVSAVKVGIEALNLALPLLLLDVFHAAAAVSALYLTAEVASLFAGLLGGALVDRVGAGRSMALTGFLQAAAIAGLPIALAAGGTWAMPVVYGLFIVNGVAGELFDVARRAALPQIVGRDEGVLKVHNGRLYVWREIAATAGVFAAGALVHSAGALATLWTHPAFCIAAAVAAFRLWRLHPGDGSHSPSPAPGSAKSVSLRAWWADLVGGMKIVLGDAQLRTLVLINIPLNSLHKIFHTLVAVVYATQILGNPAVAAVMLGAWNLGELAGAFYLERRGKESRFSTWLKVAAAASLTVWAYGLVSSAVVAVGVSFLLAAAMIGNELGTASSMQARVPESELGSVTGFVYGFSRAIGMLALLLGGWAFDALGAQTAFMVIAGIFTAMAPIYLLAAKRFSGDRLPGDVIPQDD